MDSKRDLSMDTGSGIVLGMYSDDRHRLIHRNGLRHKHGHEHGLEHGHRLEIKHGLGQGDNVIFEASGPSDDFTTSRQSNDTVLEARGWRADVVLKARKQRYGIFLEARSWGQFHWHSKHRELIENVTQMMTLSNCVTSSSKPEDENHLASLRSGGWGKLGKRCCPVILWRDLWNEGCPIGLWRELLSAGCPGSLWRELLTVFSFPPIFF